MINRDKRLPDFDGRLFLTDGGLETTLIFHKGIELPYFASFPLLDDERGRAVLRDYYETYARIALDSRCGFVLESPTWRANRDWGARLGYDTAALARINREAIDLLLEVRGRFADEKLPMIVSGNIGPRGDGYAAGNRMKAAVAAVYHSEQVRAFAATEADVVTAITLTYAEEGIGVALAAERYGLPSVIGFTTETNGRLPSGQPLGEAIQAVDEATDGGPAWYMVNCAHPDHFAEALEPGAAWTRRIRALRANASRCSHAELDEATQLDDGDPAEFGRLHRTLRERLPGVAVFGGCCGTDHRHVGAVAAALL